MFSYFPYTVYMLNVLTCNVFYSPQDVALQKLIGTVTELVKEVKELREECQEFFRQSLPSKQPLPFSVPLHNSDELGSAEEILASSEARTIMVCGSMLTILLLTHFFFFYILHVLSALCSHFVWQVKHFSIIGGTSLEVRVRRMLSWALTNELASLLNWAGKMVKKQSRQKRAFKDTFLNMCIFGELLLSMILIVVLPFVFPEIDLTSSNISLFQFLH